MKDAYTIETIGLFISRLGEMYRYFGTLTDTAVLPIPAGIIESESGYVIDCAVNYYQTPTIYHTDAQTMRRMIGNRLIVSNVPLLNKIDGFKVAAFLQLYWQCYQEYAALYDQCEMLNIGAALIGSPGVVKKLKQKLTDAPNQQAAHKYRQFFNAAYQVAKIKSYEKGHATNPTTNGATE